MTVRRTGAPAQPDPKASKIVTINAVTGNDYVRGAPLIKAKVQHRQSGADRAAAQQAATMPTAVTGARTQRFTIRELQRPYRLFAATQGLPVDG